ncbi:MAG TPA: GntR family transcriptional regulator [Amaricoccus sp.]|nr:GntR family transcriptional regulator [Amaricoccus sp.]
MHDVAIDGKPVKRSFAEDAYLRLKAQILDNALPPGYRALEAELAETLGMSRTPVREALLRLQAEGLVRVEPRRGMVVLAISPAEMAEIYDVLTALETMAAETLARLHPEGTRMRPLWEAVEDMDAALATDDLDAWADADEHFHRSLVEACGNARLAQTALTFRDQIRRTRHLTLRLRARPVRSNESHRNLLRLIEAGDAEAAFATHRAQRQRAGQELLDILRRFRLENM